GAECGLNNRHAGEPGMMTHEHMLASRKLWRAFFKEQTLNKRAQDFLLSHLNNIGYFSNIKPLKDNMLGCPSSIDIQNTLCTLILSQPEKLDQLIKDHKQSQTSQSENNRSHPLKWLVRLVAVVASSTIGALSGLSWGAIVGGLIGGVIGNLFPGLGTAAGTMMGASIGGSFGPYIGGIVGALLGIGFATGAETLGGKLAIQPEKKTDNLAEPVIHKNNSPYVNETLNDANPHPSISDKPNEEEDSELNHDSDIKYEAVLSLDETSLDHSDAYDASGSDENHHQITMDSL
ncbi:MAG TPA: hypothetical protein VIH61_07555, partial [Waddliaceae bacterium]